jgi:hypothetical protein
MSECRTDGRKTGGNHYGFDEDVKIGYFEEMKPFACSNNVKLDRLWYGKAQGTLTALW